MSARAYSVARPTGYAGEHITHCTRASLCERVTRMGLQIEDCEYVLDGEIIIRARKPCAGQPS